MTIPGTTVSDPTMPEKLTIKTDCSDSQKMVAWADEIKDLPVGDKDTVQTCTGSL